MALTTTLQTALEAQASENLCQRRLVVWLGADPRPERGNSLFRDASSSPPRGKPAPAALAY